MTRYYHVHLNRDPYCVSWDSGPVFPDAMVVEAKALGGVLLGDMPFPAKDCPYRMELDRGVPSLLATAVSLDYKISRELEHVQEALDTLCPTCGETLGDHEHPTIGGSKGVVTITSRSTGPRKKQEERLPCPHCAGPMHFNDAGAKTNFECLYRQYLVYRGEITDPLRQRLPVATHVDMIRMGQWLGSLVAPPKYGKMESASGAATFSQARGMKSGATPVLAPKPESFSITNAFTDSKEIEVIVVPAPEQLELIERPVVKLSEEEQAELRLEEQRRKDRERKAARRAALKNASR